MRIAMLGLGFMGGVHLRALREVAGATLAAVFSNDERQLSGDLTATQGNLGRPGEFLDFSAIKQYRDLAAVLGDCDIDAVDLCLPTFLHEDVAVEALRAGKHVLVEKPMALEGAGARRMIAAAERAGRILMSGQVLRFFPEYVALRNALPGLGAVRGAFFRRRCAAPAWGGWLKDPEKSGGGVFDLLIHDVDMCLHLFGRPEAVSAVGHCDAAAGLDMLHGQLFYPFGTVAVCGGWQHEGAFPFGMEYSVTLDGGTVEYSSAGRPPTLYTQTEQALPLGDGLAVRDGYAAEIEYFVECCRSGRQPERCPPRESAVAVELMRTLLAARERNGRKILCSNLE
ncbi:MAG: Gfo/Idh/MocA family oxidoreductase [Candidatus Solibacter sp.]|nr:Gfo/Idh/MocA family oxidoreductase [Candidatus Solibacter sp.]